MENSADADVARGVAAGRREVSSVPIARTHLRLRRMLAVASGVALLVPVASAADVPRRDERAYVGGFVSAAGDCTSPSGPTYALGVACFPLEGTETSVVVTLRDVAWATDVGATVAFFAGQTQGPPQRLGSFVVCGEATAVAVPPGTRTMTVHPGRLPADPSCPHPPVAGIVSAVYR